MLNKFPEVHLILLHQVSGTACYTEGSLDIIVHALVYFLSKMNGSFLVIIHTIDCQMTG